MQTTAIINPIQKHLDSKRFRDSRLWIMRGNRFFTEVEGKLIDEETFNNLFPVFNPVKFLTTKENIDSTSAWLRD